MAGTYRDESEYWPDHIAIPQNDWLFTREQIMVSASVRNGMTRKEEMAKMERMYSFMRHLKLCRSAELFLATIYLQRYYQRVPITSGNHQLYTCAVAVFLASRVLELHKTGTEIALRGAQLQFKKNLNTYSKEFWEWKDGILKGELIVMDTLCCDFNVYNPHAQMRRIMEKNPQNKFEMNSSDRDVVAFWESLSTVCLPNKALSLINMTMHTQVCLLYRIQDVMVAMMIASAIDNKLKWPKNFFATRGFKVSIPLLMEIYKYISEEQNAESRKVDFCGFDNISQDDIRSACCEDFVGDVGNTADLITSSSSSSSTTAAGDTELRNLPSLTSPIHGTKRDTACISEQVNVREISSEEHTLVVTKPLEKDRKTPGDEAVDPTVNGSLKEPTLTRAQPQGMVERAKPIVEHNLTVIQPLSVHSRGSSANSKVGLTDSHVDPTTIAPSMPTTGNDTNHKRCAVELERNDEKKASPKQFKSSENEPTIPISNKPQSTPQTSPGKKPSETVAGVEAKPFKPKSSPPHSLVMKRETSHTKNELPALPKSPLTKYSVNSGHGLKKVTHLMPDKTKVSAEEVSKEAIPSFPEEKKKRNGPDSSKGTSVKQYPAESRSLSLNNIQKHLGTVGRRSTASPSDDKGKKPLMKKPMSAAAEKSEEAGNGVQDKTSNSRSKESPSTQGRPLGSKPEERESFLVESSAMDSNSTTATKSNPTEADSQRSEPKRKGNEQDDRVNKLRRIIEHIDLQSSKDLSDLED